MRARLGLYFRLLVMIVLIGWLVTRFDARALIGEWRGPVLGPVALALVGFGVGMVIRVAKWSLQVRALGWSADVPVIRAQLWSILAGIFTPMRAGEAFRLGALPLKERDDWVRAGAALAYEKMIELLGLLVIGLVGVIWMGLPALVIAAVSAATGIGAVALLTRIRFALPTKLTAAWRARDDLSATLRLQLLGLAVVGHAANYAAIGVLYAGFGVVPAARLLVGLPLITLSSAVPITLSGIGLREVVAAEVLGGAGVSAGAAAACASLGFVGANIIPPLVGLALLAPWRAPRPA